MIDKINDKTQAMIYAELGKLAYDTVHEVMRQGEADGKSGWEERGYINAIKHAECHIESYLHNVSGDKEEHFRHALTRVAMAYYLWKREHPE